LYLPYTLFSEEEKVGIKCHCVIETLCADKRAWKVKENAGIKIKRNSSRKYIVCNNF